jgi:hypothetical protein
MSHSPTVPIAGYMAQAPEDMTFVPNFASGDSSLSTTSPHLNLPAIQRPPSYTFACHRLTLLCSSPQTPFLRTLIFHFRLYTHQDNN